MRLRHPQVAVPDPTEKLVARIREFVEGNGARFLVAIQHHDEALAAWFEASKIPFVKLEGAPAYHEAKGFGPHRTPEGHKFVAARILRLLSENHIVHADAAPENWRASATNLLARSVSRFTQRNFSHAYDRARIT